MLADIGVGYLIIGAVVVSFSHLATSGRDFDLMGALVSTVLWPGVVYCAFRAFMYGE